jgi:hypothetical protein
MLYGGGPSTEEILATLRKVKDAVTGKKAEEPKIEKVLSNSEAAGKQEHWKVSFADGAFILTDTEKGAQEMAKFWKQSHALPHLVELGRRVFDEGKTKFKDFQPRMKELLGDLWDRFKNHMLDVYERVKAFNKKLGERGAVRNPFAKESKEEHPGVKFMITRADKESLARMGYTDTMIGKLRPADAHRILDKRIPPKDFSFSGTKTAVKEPERATGSEHDLTGIAQRVREQRAAEGKTVPIEPGIGVNTEESINLGRKLLREGKDPYKMIDEFNKTGKVSYEDMAVARVHEMDLAKEAQDAWDQVKPADQSTFENYLKVQNKLAEWDKATKPMQTEWSKIGRAQQGATEVDTGNLVSMESDYTKATGKPFTPRQRKEAAEVTDRVKTARQEAKDAQEAVIEDMDRRTGVKKGKKPVTLEEARKLFSDFGVGDAMTPEQIKATWSYAKDAYINKGESNIDTVAQGVADDFGLAKKDVMKMLAGRKGTKRIMDDMYLKMSRARQAINAAKTWLQNEKTPGWMSKVRRLPRVFFSAKVFGHGTVGMITHAGVMAFDPKMAREYWSNFGRQYGLMLSPKYHEAMMQDLMSKSNFILARRAGLSNDPFRFQDDYQNPKIQLGLGKVGMAGNRGFDILKLLRQDMFDRQWNSLDAAQKTPEAAKLIADSVNHATGIVRSQFFGKLSEPLAVAFFAPKLEASRWAFMFTDPIKATKILAEWKTATPEERMFAMSEIKQKARIAGMYFGLLALNQALLSAFNTGQSINFTNPRRGDFLAFKTFGQNVSLISPMLHMVGLLANLYRTSTGKRTQLESLTPRGEEMGQELWAYGRGKLSPFSQPLVDLATQSDFTGRPMPFSKDRVPTWQRRRGIKKWTWSQYLTQQFAPIPAEEAIREVWQSQGITKSEQDKYLKAVSVFFLTGGTGIRLTEDRFAKRKAE